MVDGERLLVSLYVPYAVLNKPLPYFVKVVFKTTFRQETVGWAMRQLL